MIVLINDNSYINTSLQADWLIKGIDDNLFVIEVCRNAADVDTTWTVLYISGDYTYVGGGEGGLAGCG